ncbi:MAG TPA: MarR family transcriptional regulator [Candidatus Acidoferrum sp.]|nr:MarR family transcriptional regulator [Candidatus Acidoferrum sp.]
MTSLPSSHAAVPHPRAKTAVTRDVQDARAQAAADMFMAFRPQSNGVPHWLGQELTVAQVHALFLLGREGPMPMGRIAERLGVSMTSATGIVARIHRHGLLARVPLLDDRRVVLCMLTDAGRLVIDEMQGRRADVATKALAVLDEQELAEFHRLIRLILERTTT